MLLMHSATRPFPPLSPVPLALLPPRPLELVMAISIERMLLRVAGRGLFRGRPN
jgi:hypothetical protein